MTIRVVVVDDHYVTRTGTIAIVQRDPRYEIVGEAEDGARALALCLELHPDLVLLDTRLPKMDGPTVARTLQMMASPPRILMLSGYGDAASVCTALDAGATGYVLKSVGGADLLAAIGRVLQGDQVLLGVDGAASEGPATLSPQEVIVLGYVAAGMPSKEIAQQVHVSLRTIDTYLARIFRKLDAHNRTEAVARARREGFLSADADQPDSP
jgi:two-component system nitrate/nitrite response regulator NarL